MAAATGHGQMFSALLDVSRLPAFIGLYRRCASHRSCDPPSVHDSEIKIGSQICSVRVGTWKRLLCRKFAHTVTALEIYFSI